MQTTRKVSAIDYRTIRHIGIVNGRLAIECGPSDVYGHPAGTLVADPVGTVDRSQECPSCSEGSPCACDTVTRLGRRFMDEGAFTPRT